MRAAWTVRTARTGGREVVDVLAEAFGDDPWLQWALPDASAVRSLMSLFLRVIAGPHGHVLLAEDSGGETGGVAILLPPDVAVELDPQVGAHVLALHGRHAGRALDGDAVLERHRPEPGSWVLHTLGVRPSMQGQGVGGALLSRCTEMTGGAPLAVETSSASARDFYRRRGFEVTDVVDLSAGHGLGSDAPTVWMMQHPG